MEISSAGLTSEDLDEREIGGNLTWTEQLGDDFGMDLPAKNIKYSSPPKREKQNPTKTVMVYTM